MDIDIKTIALFYFIANAMNNGLMVIIWRMYRKHFRGLSFLFMDMCLQTLGSLFLLLRGVLPDFVSIVLTNLFSVFGLICLFIGLELFFERYKPRIYNYIIFAIYMVLIVYFSAFQDNLFVRNILLSSSIVFYTGQSSALLFWGVWQGVSAHCPIYREHPGGVLHIQHWQNHCACAYSAAEQ